MVSEPGSVLEDAELRDIIARYDAKFRKTMARYEASCESHFDQIMQILTRQESRFNQILAHQQTITGQFRPTTEKYINPFTPAATSHSPHFTQTVTPTNPPPPMLTTIDTTLPLKRAQFHLIHPPTQVSTTTHITPHHTIYDQKNIKKIVQLHVLQVAVCDLDRFQHRNLPTPSHATVFVADKPVIAIHLNTWRAATLPMPISSIDRLRSSSESRLMVFPLLVFDPGGNGSIEEVGAIGCKLGDVSPQRIQIFALRTRHSKEGGMIRVVHGQLHAMHGRMVVRVVRGLA